MAGISILSNGSFRPGNGEVMDIVGLLIGLGSGALGGNVAGKVMNSGMGTMGRSLTGIIGGTGLAALAPMIPGLGGIFADPSAGGALNVSSILGNVVSGGVGGGLLTFILGLIKK
jgi:hypothetical protein